MVPVDSVVGEDASESVPADVTTLHASVVRLAEEVVSSLSEVHCREETT